MICDDVPVDVFFEEIDRILNDSSTLTSVVAQNAQKTKVSPPPPTKMAIHPIRILDDRDLDMMPAEVRVKLLSNRAIITGRKLDHEWLAANCTGFYHVRENFNNWEAPAIGFENAEDFALFKLKFEGSSE